MTREYDVFVCGPLAGCDEIMAAHLARVGFHVLLARHENERNSFTLPTGYRGKQEIAKHVDLKSSLDTLYWARQCRMVVSFTGYFGFLLGRLWPLRKILGLPPIMAIATGSDTTEMLDCDTPEGRRFRQYLHMTRLNWCIPLPHALKNLIKYRIPNVVFMQGFPFLVPDLDAGAWQGHEPYTPPAADEPLRLFHCSHIDWNYTGFSRQRNSTKGNDKFIRAFIRALQQGCKLKLRILDRGVDRGVAREMFKHAGVEEHVTWLEHLDRDALYKEIKKSHVVVNMFAHGGAGGISFESIALGRPLMQYANPTYFQLMYGGAIPPFIECFTEDEIFEKLLWCRDTDRLPAVAQAGREWIDRHIAPENSMTGFRFYYSHITGDQKIDCGAHIQEMENFARSVEDGSYDPLAGLVTRAVSGEGPCN